MSKPIECTTPRVNPNVTCGLRVVMCPCMFTSCDKCTALVGLLIMERLCVLGAGAMWEISVPAAQYCCELKTALKKIKSLKKNKNKKPRLVCQKTAYQSLAKLTSKIHHRIRILIVIPRATTKKISKKYIGKERRRGPKW